MNERFENIDQYFKDELENYSPEVPAMAWDNISQSLNAGKSKKLRGFYYKIAAGLALLLSVGSIIALLLTDNDSFTNSQDLAATVDSSNNKQETTAIPKEQIVFKSDVEAINTEPESSTQDVSPIISRKQENVPGNYHNEFVAYSESTSDREEYQYEKATNINGAIPYTAPTGELIIKTNIVPDEYASFEEFAEYEEIIFEENTKRGSKWMVGGQAGPQYSYREINSQTLSDEMLARYNEKEEGLIAYAGGVNVEYHPVRRLSIQSGVYYSKMGQQKPAELQAPNSSVPHAQRYNPNYNENQTASYKVSNSTGNIVFTNVNTPTTNNKSNQLDLVTDKPSISEANQMVSESISLSQYFEYIEVPLIARYSLIDRKFGIHLLGGISTNFLVGNSVYLDNQPDSPAGHTEGVAPVNYSSTVGFGLGYTMSDKLKITIEPQLKYYLSNQINHSNISVNPYTIGVMTGIKYMF